MFTSIIADCLVSIVAVSLLVFGQVIRPHEAFVANSALKPLLPRVSSEMSLEFIRSCESLATEQPVTHKRSLSRVPSQVGL